ncbi:MAG: GNAT family N-acetyltransferase [Candidatus Binataceae bacterium]
MSGVPKVSVLFPSQFEQAAVALGRAFVRDPALMAVLPENIVSDPAERVRRLTNVFRTALGIQRREGEPVVGVLDGGTVVGVAVIAGGASSVGTLLGFGLPGMPRMIRSVGWGGTVRSLQLMDTLARNHPPEPHIYLNFLGVDPAHQRKHYGVALLNYLRDLALERTDLAGVYLETATEANVPYYGARGYKVVGEIYPLGVRFWRMFQAKGAGL